MEARKAAAGILVGKTRTEERRQDTLYYRAAHGAHTLPFFVGGFPAL